MLQALKLYIGATLIEIIIFVIIMAFSCVEYAPDDERGW